MQHSLIFLLFLFICAPCLSDTHATERIRPTRISALTDSWGPTPGVIGLRDGLKELGYLEAAAAAL